MLEGGGDGRRKGDAVVDAETAGNLSEEASSHSATTWQQFVDVQL